MNFDFELNLPYTLVSGENSSDLVGEKTKNYGEKALLIMDPFFKGGPVAEKIIGSLKNAGVEVVEFYDVVPNPRNTTIDRAADLARQNQCKAVVAVGGGSTIDTAKAVALVAHYGGKCWEYTERLGEEVKRPDKPGLPLIAVTTTAGTGSEVTPYAVINNPEVREKNSISNPAIYARTVIIDPVLMLNMPRKTTALTGIDAFCHCFESYLHTGSTFWSEMLSLQGMKVFAENIRECCFNGQNLEARTKMAWANTLGGMAIAVSGCTIPHAIGQPVGAMTDAAHGATLAACYPAILRWTLPVAQDKFAITAEILDPSVKNLSEKEKAERLPEICENLFEELVGEKLTFGGFGLKEDEIDPLADLIIKCFTWNLEFHPKVPSKEEIICLIKESM